MNATEPFHYRGRLFVTLMACALLAVPSALTAQFQSQLSNTVVKTVLIQGKLFTTIQGNLSVPANYQLPGKKYLTLPVFIVKALDADPKEPIFWLDGGPGGSNLLSIEKIISSNPADMLQSHDLVCMGYRGVDGPLCLEAPAVRKAMRGYKHELLSDLALNKIKVAIAKTSKEFEEKSIDLNDFNIRNVVEDLEFTRAAFHYKKIHLLSVSYGTRVALLYSYLYPSHLYRTLMIGASPPGCFLGKPDNVEKILDRYEVVYQEQFKGTNSMELKEMMQIALDNLPRRWSIYRLNKDKIKAGTVNALYATGFAVIALDAYKKAALHNDYSGLYLLQKIYDMGRSKLLADVYVKTVSADANDFSDPDAFKTELRKTNAILGPHYSLLYVGTYAQWKILPIEKQLKRCQASSAATLIVSGDLDFRTPEWEVNELLMPYLSNAQHLVLKNHGHADLVKTLMGNAAFLQKYFEEGIVKDELLAPKTPPDFKNVSQVGKHKIFAIGLIK